MVMQTWFEDAKLGIFIHWGIYAVDGVAESWSFWRGDVSYDSYMAQLPGFTASAFDAEQWAELFADAGARYAVLTTKHHDGVALFDTDASDLSVVKRTPAGRDLVKDYTQAIRRAGMKVGFYFSHADWSHPDYPSVRPSSFHPWLERPDSSFSYPAPGAEDPQAWERFLTFHRAQLRELCERFAPDLMWFDGEWERDAAQWRADELAATLQDWVPQLVVNGRLPGQGDYATPEQGLPVQPPDGPWELCLTINDSWGFQHRDTNYKSPLQILRIFLEVIAGGGNLLLDVGPREDGTIPTEQVAVLRSLGAWIRGHEQAVYGTRRGLDPGHVSCPTTRSQDGRSLFLLVVDAPQEFLMLNGLLTAPVRATIVSTGEQLRLTRMGGLGDVPGVDFVHVDAPLPELPTAIRLDFDEPLRVYRGAGRA